MKQKNINNSSLKSNISDSILEKDINSIQKDNLGNSVKKKDNYLGSDKIIMENFMFTLIKDMLDKNPINKDTQLKIETLVFEGFKEYFSKPHYVVKALGIFNTKLLNNVKFKKFIINSMDSITKLLESNRHSIKEKIKNNKSKKGKDKDILLEKILSNIDSNYIVSRIINCFFIIITNYNLATKDDDYNSISNVHITVELGKKIINDYILILREEQKGLDIKLRDFKAMVEKYPYHNMILSTDFALDIGSGLLDIMKIAGLVQDKLISKNKQKLNIVSLTSEVIDICGIDLVNRPLSIPLNLPMIVEPKEYSSNIDLEDGGYLLNNKKKIDPLFAKNEIQPNKTKILKDNIVLDSLNNIMKIPFKINTELLDYIFNNTGFINLDTIPPYNNIKRTKVQEKEYQRWVSENLLTNFTLSIARTYRDVPKLYFPVSLDFRGRLYPKVSYLNYQSTELAKSLLLFATPGVVKRNDKVAIDYLKSYGAVCFGHNLDKKPYNQRVDWIRKNWEDIIGLNKELLLKADNKLNFLSFCLEMKRFDQFYNNELSNTFKTYLPIQLDATCNGFQHLALLSDEVSIFETLNLGPSKPNNGPEDFYTFILNKINAHMQSRLVKATECIEKNRINRLLQMDFNRSNIKQLVMTKPYNASTFTLVDYIANGLVYIGRGEVVGDKINLKNPSELKPINKVDNLISNDKYSDISKHIQDTNQPKKSKNKIWDKSIEPIYSSSKTSTNLVSRSDLLYYVDVFNDLIFIDFPHIKKLMEYLDIIVDILYDLSLPIIWRLPHGLEVSQKYSKKTTRKLRPHLYSNQEICLTITDKTKIDKIKQKNALMPNLVHSLDAASLILLYFYLKTAFKNEHVNFYSVHDCFGVTADKVEMLIMFIRKAYISIYSDVKYIETFDKDVIENIKIHLGEHNVEYIENKREIIIKDHSKVIKLPPMPYNYLDKDIINYYNKLKKADYLIN